MFHSIIITNANFTSRLKKAQSLTQDPLTPSPDTLILDDKPSIGINHIRQLEKFLQRKPYQKDKKIAFFPHAKNLSLPAQNALLKTLEEPPQNSQIILAVANHQVLLPTIISRCQIHKLPSLSTPLKKDLRLAKKNFTSISSASLSEKINLVSSFAGSKITAQNLVKSQIIYLRFLLLKSSPPDLALVKLIRKLIQTRELLTANINPRLSLENLFFHYPKQANFAKIE